MQELCSTVAVRVKHQLSPQMYCWDCKAWYKGRLRKHCWTCNKCVVGFDHHCKYLSTCIGSSNYPMFLILLLCLVGCCVAGVVGQLYFASVLLMSDTGEGGLEAQALATCVRTDYGEAFWLAHVFVSTLLQGAGTCALGSLLQFHVRLLARRTWHRAAEYGSSYAYWGNLHDDQQAEEKLRTALHRIGLLSPQSALAAMRLNYSATKIAQRRQESLTEHLEGGDSWGETLSGLDLDDTEHSKPDLGSDHSLEWLRVDHDDHDEEQDAAGPTPRRRGALGDGLESGAVVVGLLPGRGEHFTS